MAGRPRPGGNRAALLAVLDPATGAWGGLPFALPGDQGRDQVRAEAVEGEVTPLLRRQPPRQEVDAYVAGVCRFYRSDSAGLRPRDVTDEAQDDVAVDRADDLLGQRPVGEVAPGQARQRLATAAARASVHHPATRVPLADGSSEARGLRAVVLQRCGATQRSPGACAGTDGASVRRRAPRCRWCSARRPQDGDVVA